MSYENNVCPCGDKKENETFLCTACVAAFEERYEMKNMNDTTATVDSRRHSAIILVTLAKNRKRAAAAERRVA